TCTYEEDPEVEGEDPIISECQIREGSAYCRLPNNENCFVNPEDETALCDNQHTQYTIPGSGMLEVPTDTEVGYLENDPQCEDVWSDRQVLGEVMSGAFVGPGQDITIRSYYNLVFETAENPIEIIAETTPCLCLADPDNAEEGDFIRLAGKNFGLADGQVSFFGGNNSPRINTNDYNPWGDLEITDVVVPLGAITGTLADLDDQDPPGADPHDGIYVLNALNRESNALDFRVTCLSDRDCSTACCLEGQCAEADACNACLDMTDCLEADGCGGDCIEGLCAPVISELSPNVGAEGQPVTVRGCHLGSYNLQSGVYFDDIAADFICENYFGGEPWNNHEILIKVPNDSLDLEEANVQVRRYTNQQGELFSNNEIFTEDESCLDIDIPELCVITPYETYEGPVDMQGNDIMWGAGGYCECENEDIEDETCLISENELDGNCTGTNTHTLYAWSEYPEQVCTVDMDSYVEGSDTCEVCHEDYPGECCSIPNDQTSASCEIDVSFSCDLSDTIYLNSENQAETCINTHADWDAGRSQCIAYNPDNNNLFCYVNENDSSCEVICNADYFGYTVQGGEAIFTSNKPSPNFTVYNFLLAETTVPPLADAPTSGDAHLEASINANTCSSNGLDFAISCNECADCVTGNNCVRDGLFGYCSSETVGFCRSDSEKECCGNVGCEFDGSVDITEDPGTCTDRPNLSSVNPINGTT
ncbi:MAG: hypothetical protein ABIJ97_08820, partial [Bacteroidota bacterium]